MSKQMLFSAWREQQRIDASTAVWVCEKGHIDDYHYELTHDLQKATALCSRCGEKTRLYSLDQFAYELRKRTAERDQLRKQVEKLLGAVNVHRANREQHPKGPSKRNQALWAAADQVRKELEGNG